MAARFWVGGTGNWSDNTNHWSATSGGSPGAAAPTTSDDVTFDTLSHTASFTFTVDTTASCKSFTVGNPLTGSPTWAGSSSFTCSGAGSVFSLVSGMTRTFTGAMTMSGSGANTFTTNGVTTASSISFAGSGSWTLQDNWSNTGSNVTHTNATFDTNGKTVTCGTFQSTGTNARTLTLGASIINCSAFTSSGTGLTLNENTSSIRISASGTFAGNSDTYYDVQYGAAVAATISGTNTFTTLSITGTSTKTCQMILSGNQTCTTSFTVAGNSSTARMLIKSDVKATARTITSASNVISNADFQDITGAGAGSWNLAAITGLSGDCGGNSGITLTTGATQYWQSGAGSFNFSTVAKWFLATNGGGGAGRVPLPQDDVVFDANSMTAGGVTVVGDMPRSGKNITWTGVTNTPAFNIGSAAKSIFGSLTLASGMTIVTGVTLITFEGRGSFTLTSAGLSFISSITLDAPGGTITQQDAFSIGATLTLTVTSGTWSSGTNFTQTMGLLSSSNSNTRTINRNNSTSTLSGTGTVLDLGTTTGLTWSQSGSSTMVVSDTSATAKTITAGNQSFDTLTVSGDNATLSGGSSIGTLNVNTAGLTNGLKLTSSTTTTITSSFATNGSLGNLAKLVSSSAGTAATLSKSSGTISVDYMSIKDSAATGGASWYAGANSTNVSGNSGWTFTAPPANSRYWVGGSGNWSDNTNHWSATSGGAGGASLPSSTEDVFFDTASNATAYTMTVDTSANCKTFTMTNPASGAVTMAGSSSLTVAPAGGAFSIPAGMTMSWTGTLSLNGSGSNTLTTNSISLSSPITFAGTGTWTFQNSIVTSATSTSTVTSGTVEANTFNLTTGLFNISGSTARTFNLGNGTLTVNGTGSVFDSTTTTNLTWTLGGSSTVQATNTSATAKTFTSSLTFDTLTFSGDNITRAGSSTSSTLNVNTAGLTTGLIITAGTTQTLTTFATNGTAGNLAKMLSSSAGSAFNLSKASGTVSVDYMSIKDSAAAGGATWYAGANSTDVSGNTGWIFSAPGGTGRTVIPIARTGAAARTIAGARTVAGSRTVVV